MTIAAFQLLNMGGGQTPDVWDKNSFFIPFEDRTFLIKRGIFEMNQLFIDIDSTKKKWKMDWSEWLNGSTIASISLASEPTDLTISSSSFTAAGVVTAYLNSPSRNAEHFVKVTITTSDAIPEVESRSIRVISTRTT